MRAEESSSLDVDQGLKAELKELLENENSFHVYANCLFPNGSNPDGFFFKTILRAYSCFEASDLTRQFINGIMVEIVGNWDPEQKTAWIVKSAQVEASNLFEMIDFSTEVFHRIELNPKAVSIWIETVYKTIRQDLYQSGFWICLKNYCDSWPTYAFQSVQLLVSTSIDGTSEVIPKMISLLRNSEKWRCNDRNNFLNFEAQLCESSISEKRALYIKSWAHEVRSSEVNQGMVLSLKPDFVAHREPEITAWIFLVSILAREETSEWWWIIQEFQLLIDGTELNMNQRYWIWATSFFGWLNSKEDLDPGKEQWETLCLKLPPLTSKDKRVWNEIDYIFCDEIKTNPIEVIDYLIKLVSHSGDCWKEKADPLSKPFPSLYRTLKDFCHLEYFITALSLNKTRITREIGLTFFEIWEIKNLDRKLLNCATLEQNKLIALEVSLVHLAPNRRARLHLLLWDRIRKTDQIFINWFTSEVILEALSTYEYRKEIRENTSKKHEILSLIKNVEKDIDALNRASKSPSLQMEIPGFKTASRLAAKKFSRDVDKGAKEHSILLSMCQHVDVLYASNWRILQNDGTLSKTSSLKRSSVSTEIPRIAFINPEMSQYRRIDSLLMIEEVEKTIKETPHE